MLTDISPGVVIGDRFRLERRLGQGGMGEVWAATHVVTRKPVALKFLNVSTAAKPDARRRFHREARAASAVRHPNVVEIHDVLDLEVPVMVMDLLEGENLGTRIERTGRLSLAETTTILLPVISAVGSAHALGIVHRDLKPDNIFLQEDHGVVEAKVLDFGIAKLTATEGVAAETGVITGTGTMLGTPYYMAPEQAYGEKDIDHRADIWALGVILYECLSGQRPFVGDNFGQIMKAITTSKPTPLSQLVPDLPESVDRLVRRMLSHSREQRPVDLREVLVALSEFCNVSVRQFGSAQFNLVSPDEKSSSPLATSDRIVVGRETADPNAPTNQAVPGETPPSHTGDPYAVPAGTSRPRSRIPWAAGVAGFGLLAGLLMTLGTRTSSEDAEAASSPIGMQATAKNHAPALSVAPTLAVAEAAPLTPLPTPAAPASASTPVPMIQPSTVPPSTTKPRRDSRASVRTSAAQPVATATTPPTRTSQNRGGILEKPPF